MKKDYLEREFESSPTRKKMVKPSVLDKTPAKKTNARKSYLESSSESEKQSDNESSKSGEEI